MSSELDPSFFPPVPAPLPPSEKLDGLNDYDARLIFDLVAGIRNRSAVLAQYGLSYEQFVEKTRSPMFAAAYRETDRLWKSDMNTSQRIRMKAAFLLEDSLVPLFNVIRDPAMGVTAKLNAIEQLTKISTVANVPKDAAQTEQHKIIIQIGAAAAPIVVTSAPAQQDRHVGYTLSPAE